MKSKIFVLAAFLSASFFLSAQEQEKKEKNRYSNLTEVGVFAASFRGVSIEATTAHGVSFNEKQHHFGLGIGIGLNFSRENQQSYYVRTETIYMPIFLNYRYYFKPNRMFSPHVNAAIGGLAVENGAGFYSAVTMGFKAGVFSFSSGLSFMPFYKTEEYAETIRYNSFGVTLKVGFSF